MAIENHGRADHGRIGAILLLPSAITQHRDGRSRGLVVRGYHRASYESADSKSGEIVAADKFSTQRLSNAVGLATASGELGSACLECGELGELRGGFLHSLIKGIGVYAPVFLRASLYAAIAAVANAVETCGIDDRQ